MKRIVSVFLMLCMLTALLASMPITASASTSGTCGENLQWSLDDNGKLTIFGTGPMSNFDGTYMNIPWYDVRNNIKSVDVASGVTSIEGWAFCRCENLESIYISNSVTNITGHFNSEANCGKLKFIFVDNNNSYFSSLDGVLFDKAQSKLILYPAGISPNFYYIPNGVISISDYAFAGSNLVDITISSSVEEVSEDAFLDCKRLENINVDITNSTFSSANGVLFDKDMVALVLYPNGKNNSEYNIPASVETILPNAFRNCKLIKVTIPNTVKYIEYGAFRDSKNLNDIKIPNSVTYIGDYAFYGCESLRYLNFGRVTSISTYAFCDCRNLETILIPSTVKFLETYSFSNCINLQNIETESENTVYSSRDGVLFNKNQTKLIRFPIGKKIDSYDVPYGVTHIGSNAFSSCGVKNINIPNTVEEIGSTAFGYSDSLESLTIPRSVTTIESWAFSASYNLNNIYYEGTKEEWETISFGSFGGAYGQLNPNATIHCNSPLITDEPSTLIPNKNNGYKTSNRFGKGVSIKISGVDGEIPNATVVVGDYETKTDSNGIANFPAVELRKPYIVKVVAEGYFNQTSLETFYNNTKDITMLSTTDNIFISSVFYGKGNYVHGDLINHNTATIENTDGDTYFIAANVDWGNNPVGTISLYGKNSKKSLAFTENKLSTTIGTQFGAGESFQLIIKTNGKTYTKDLKLKTRALPKNVEIKLPDIESDIIPSGFPFLGDSSFKFSLDLTEAINTSADVKIEDDKVVITIDYANEKVKQQYANIFGDKAVKGTVGVKIEIPVADLSGGQWSGYVTFKSGNKEKSHGVADYLGLATIDKTFWITTPMGAIPTYMTLNLSASLDVEVGVDYKKPDWTLNGSIKPGIKGRFSGGLGVAYDSFEINVGPYGSAALKADVTLNPISMQPKVSLDFGMQVTTKAWFIDAKGEFGMGHWEWPNNQRMMLMALETSDAQLIERDYEEYPNEFLPAEISFFSAQNTDNDVRIFSNVFPSVQSRLTKVGGKEILLFTNDNTERETQNGLTLQYSVKENDSWTTPQVIADDGTLDSSINIAGDYVVWENTKQVLNANETNLTNVLSLSEIVVAKYNGSEYDAPIVLTDNNIADFSPVIAQNGENVIVAWLSNTESDIFSQTGTTNVHYKTFDGTTWGETQSVENIGSVTRIEVKYVDGTPIIFYKKDNSISMVDVSNGETDEIYSGDILQYTSSSKGVYVFTNEGKIEFVSYEGDKDIIADDVACVSIPQAVSNSNETYLIWCENDDNGTNLCGIKNSGSGWSKKIDIKSGAFDVITPFVYLTDEQFSVSYIRRDNINNLPEGSPMPDKIISDLFLSEIRETYDLALEDINYSDTVTCVVKNTGTEDVNGFNVTITQNNTILTMEEISETIKAGDAITKVLSITDFDPAMEAELAISLIDTEDADTSNNSTVFNVVGSDPEVLSAKMVVNENESYIESEIVNSGLVSDDSVVVELRKGSISGDVIYSEAYTDVLPSEKILFKYDITETDINYYVCLIAQNDEKAWNNFGLCAKMVTADEISVVVQGDGNGTVTGGGQYAIESDVTVSATPEDGYKFSGWYFNDALISQESNYTFKAECDIELVAKFTKETSVPTGGGGGGVATYTVKFETNGGSAVKAITVNKNAVAAEPTVPTKEGFKFDGWYTDKELTTAYDFTAKVTKNFTLYAKWTEIEKEPEEDKTEISMTFTDVKSTDWFFDSVKYVADNKLMNGVSETEFAPDNTLTRAMLVTVLYRNAGEPATNRSIPFADIDMGAYYANAVSWAKQNGIISGVTENEFAPDANITREQIATIMFRYAQYKGYDVSVGENTNILSYDDFDSISEYAIAAMQYACGSGLMKGKTASTLNPKDNATRAEIAAVLYRFIEANK